MRMLQITGCRDSSMWYADKVGQLVELRCAIPEGYLARESSGCANIVLHGDAKVVEIVPLENDCAPPPGPLRVVLEVELPASCSATTALELRKRFWRMVEGFTYAESAKCTFVPLP